MRHLIVVCVLVAAGRAAAEDYPHVYLKNDTLTVKVYLPDAEKGFYRGTRFDHAGVFGEIEFAGHKLFGPWKDRHDPTNYDDILGPCEEFGNEKPLGYDEAKAGETFLKIGVGELEKPKEEKYHFANKYKVVEPLGWKKVRRRPGEGDGAEGVAWEAESGLSSGYRYMYQKRLILAREGRHLRIGHVLTNTGTKAISTDFYNHNFFNVDKDGVGPNYSVAFSFEPKPQNVRGRFADLIAIEGKGLRFRGPLDEGFVMAGLTGFEPKRAAVNAIEMRHGPSGVRVKATQTDPFSKVNLWGIKTTICPEPYVQIELKPGESKGWEIGYEFLADEKKK